MKKVGYAVLVISSTIILLDAFTPLEVNKYNVHLGLVFLSATSLAFIKSQQAGRRTGRRVIVSMALIAALACVVLRMINLGSDWATQAIMYQNSRFQFGTVEYQMMDEGAFGSRQRIVERYKILPFIDWLQQVEPNFHKTHMDWFNNTGPYNGDGSTWKRVDIDVNELGLKYRWQAPFKPIA